MHVSQVRLPLSIDTTDINMITLVVSSRRQMKYERFRVFGSIDCICFDDVEFVFWKNIFTNERFKRQLVMKILLMLSIISVAICITEINKNKSEEKEEYVVEEPEFETVNWFSVRGACKAVEFWYTGVLITSFSGVSAFITDVEIGSLVKIGRLTTG